MRTSVDGSVNQIRTAKEPLNDLNFSDLHKETAMEASLELVVEYEVEPPFSSVKIVRDIRTGTVSYIVNEPDVGGEVAEMARIARQILISSLKSFPRTEQERLNYLREFLADFKKSREGRLSKIDLEKIFYLLQRELQGYGPVQVPVLDDNVEDISCVGPNAQIYVVHRKFGSISTNIEFENEDELDDFVRRIVQRSGKHISIAVPMVDCTMPNGARLQATLGREVTKNGSSFTIRRFREQPFTPLDLIKIRTMSPEIAVYLWQAVEAEQNMFVIGGTATGKTTTLNSILLFVPPEKKLVSIEDTRELNIPHENWIQMLTRPGTGDVNPATKKRVGELDMFNLLVNSLRQRPDYTIVGEVRGREAYTVFQAMSTGQSVISTFHANDIPSFVHRLEGEPLNIPRAMISSLDIVILQTLTKVGKDTVRRIKKIVEIVDLEKTSNEVVTNTVFEWDPDTDKFTFSGHSYFQNKLLKNGDLTSEQFEMELIKRRNLLDRLAVGNSVKFSNFADEIHRMIEKPGSQSKGENKERSGS